MSGGMTISENFSNLLVPGLHAAFFIGIEKAPEVYSRVFNVLNSTSKTETDQPMGGIGDWEQRDDDGPTMLSDFVKGYEKTYTNLTYRKELEITREAYEDDRFSIFARKAEIMGVNGMNTVEKISADIFNNAFDSNYPGGDAVALCSASHPYSADDAGVQSNTGTDQLDADALESAYAALTTQESPDRSKMSWSESFQLIVPPALRATAKALADSEKKPGTANNDINTFAGNIDVVVMPHLSSSTAWFIVDPLRHMLNFFWRIKPEFAELTRDADKILTRGRMRFSVGFSDWRGVWGSTGAGA